MGRYPSFKTIRRGLPRKRAQNLQRNKNKLGQYFTPTPVCDFMVSLSSSSKDAKVLEPSSGAGAFLDSLEKAGYENVHAVEIDSSLANHRKYKVSNMSFLSYEPDIKFDLVIGNPPYIRWKDLADEQKAEISSHRLFGGAVNSLSDYLVPFIMLSVEHLKTGGELIFITPSFWMQTQHSQGVRDFLANSGEITDVFDFGEANVFEKVSTSLVIFKFVKGKKNRPTRLHKFSGNKDEVKEGLSLDSFKSEVVSQLETRGKFVLSFDAETDRAKRLEMFCRERDGLFEIDDYSTLGGFIDIANGMVTGLDEAFKLSQIELSELPKAELSGTSKILKAKDVLELYSPHYTTYIDLPKGLNEEELSKKYPHLYRRLLSHKQRLLERYDYGRGGAWWEWGFYRSESFHRSKITKGFVPGKERLSNRVKVRFCLGPSDAIATQDVTAFGPKSEVREDVRYIVAYLNNKLVSDWIRVFGLMKGGVAEFSEKPLSEIPFRAINWGDPSEVCIHDAVVGFVDALVGGSIEQLFAEKMISEQFQKLFKADLVR